MSELRSSGAPSSLALPEELERGRGERGLDEPLEDEEVSDESDEEVRELSRRGEASEPTLPLDRGDAGGEESNTEAGSAKRALRMLQMRSFKTRAFAWWFIEVTKQEIPEFSRKMERVVEDTESPVEPIKRDKSFTIG